MRNYTGLKMIVSVPAEAQPYSLSRAFTEIPNKVIEGTSHWIQMDKPEEFNRLLDEFLKTVEKK